MTRSTSAVPARYGTWGVNWTPSAGEEDDLMEPDSPLEDFHSLVVERFEVSLFYFRMDK